MPTSELLDALNPHAAHPRTHNAVQEYNHDRIQHIQQPIYQQPQVYIPHRSELELAIAEPPPPPPPPRDVPNTPVKAKDAPLAEGLHELFRFMSATKQAQESERCRRLQWEQEQGAKFLARQADLERRILDLQQEVSSLRAIISSSQHIPVNRYPHSTSTEYDAVSSAVQAQPQPQSHALPAFVQGSSTSTYDSTFYGPPATTYSDISHPQYLQHSEPPQTHPMSMNTPAPMHTPSPPPQLHPLSKPSGTKEILGPSSKQSSPTSGGDDSDTSEISDVGRGNKRISHHDKRCFTIHHAMRKHILHLMQVHGNDKLPPSHTEGEPLGPDDPIRFVWDKTTRQSVHNARTKARVLEDLKANRKFYPEVVKRDFNKKILESTFEQSFTHFRQKFKTQVDETMASRVRDREQTKARKSRHVARRKLKLINRAEARLKIQAFEHVVFDGALQVDCMSSEDSDPEYTPSTSHGPGLLRTRGYLWRSTRLMRFYCILDNEEKASKSSKPKRGSGKMERCAGPPKDGFHLPPKGVAKWMISRTWLSSTQEAHPDLPDVLGNLVTDTPGFDWQHFELLGEESDVPGESGPQPHNHDALDRGTIEQAYYGALEADTHTAAAILYPPQPQVQMEQHLQQTYTTHSSSLAYALM